MPGFRKYKAQSTLVRDEADERKRENGKRESVNRYNSSDDEHSLCTRATSTTRAINQSLPLVLHMGAPE